MSMPEAECVTDHTCMLAQATQDLPLPDVPPRPRSVASGTDGEWHMVSPNGSDKAPSV
jgi:hypothetical protein